MNNTDMETFWAVLEHGTLTAAAEALFITQPTLTNRIQSLEAEVGAQLFHLSLIHISEPTRQLE